MEDIYKIFFCLFLCLGMCAIIAYIICDTLKKINMRNNIAKPSELMEVVNETINREFTYKTQFEFKIKHIRVIGDFEKEVNDLVTKTMNSLSPDILRDLEYYYKLDTLTRIVFKAHTILLIDYMNKNNIEFKNKVQSR